MSRTEVRDDERAAVDAIGAVVDVAHCERLEPPGHIKTPRLEGDPGVRARR